jgi:hypothetical protein
MSKRYVPPQQGETLLQQLTNIRTILDHEHFLCRRHFIPLTRRPDGPRAERTTDTNIEFFVVSFVSTINRTTGFQKSSTVGLLPFFMGTPMIVREISRRVSSSDRL